MAAKVLAPETRTVTSQIEMRMEGDAPVLVGYAATFNQEYDLGAFREVIDPGAFSRTLGTQPDVRLLIDHEGQPLARTKSGTLTLRDRDDAGNPLPGLQVRAQLDPSDPDVQRLIPKMRRGDLDQMSFAFRVPTGGDTWSDDYGLRTLRSIELNGGDVSVVTYPANPATSASVRARDLRSAQAALLEHVSRELRVGKTLSVDTITKLQEVLASLAVIDSAIDSADAGIDDAQAKMADLLGVPNPDPADPDDAPARSGRPLGLAVAQAKRLDIPA
ncbi:MAG: HK97 family phage prohead protease [Blastococcus sp.]